MNKKNLILTSTVDMSREEWLAFRRPMNHVKPFILAWVRSHLGVESISGEEFFRPGSDCTSMLKECFKSKEWAEFLFPCIGGSEIAVIVGLNPYYSAIELFYEKVGVKPSYDEDNVAMFWGRELEEQIAEKWQYWDGTPEGMIENFKKGTIIRRCRRLNAYVQNKETPWIFISLDRLINKQRSGTEEKNEGSLEAKTIVGWAAKMWEHEIPPMYVAQLQTQLLTCEMDFGEIAILKDGRYFDVHPFDKHDAMCERLVREAKAFFDRVKKGIEFFLLHNYSIEEQTRNEFYAELERLAPEPDGSESYKAYMSATYVNSISGAEIEGTEEEDAIAQDYKYYDQRMKQFDELKTLCRNKLTALMKDVPVLKLSVGKVTWKEEGQKGRVFRVNVKIDPTYKPRPMEQQLASQTIAGDPKAEDVEQLPFGETEEKKPRSKKKTG